MSRYLRRKPLGIKTPKFGLLLPWKVVEFTQELTTKFFGDAPLVLAFAYRVFLICLWLLPLVGNPAIAASIRPSFSAGLMVPPSSHYYHYVFGTQIDLAREFDRSLIRLQYLQRPKFTSRGYTDQDFSGLVLLGQSILQRKNIGVTTLIGGGYAWGYIKSVHDSSDMDSYKIPGLAVALEGRWSIDYLDVRLAHQVLVGHSTSEQLNAYVAWPFNWFVLSFSHPIEI
jgi:hypothetical protein